MTLLAFRLGAILGWLATLLPVRSYLVPPSGSRDAEPDPSRDAQPDPMTRWSFPSRPRLPAFDAGRWSPQGRPPGAIVVPTIRSMKEPRTGLRLAARLAADVGCPLVVLVSKEAAKRESIDDLRAQLGEEVAARTLVVHVADSPGNWTRFAVDELTISREHRQSAAGSGSPLNDAGRKRSLAILLARSMGWSSLLLLDDDVYTDVETDGQPCERHNALDPRTLDVTTLCAAVAAVEAGEHDVVGFVVQDFDDNSVLFRMCKVLGEKPRQFMGGGAMICRIDDRTPFFSSIYNEDWLFLLALVLWHGNRRPWAEAGSLHQDPYAPYETSRAASEELGDLLGEGMMSLVTAGAREVPIAGVHYWWAMIRQRIALRRELEAGVHEWPDPEKEQMALALKTVTEIHHRLECDQSFWCQQFVSYQYTWRRDLRTWFGFLRRPPKPQALFRSNEVASEGVTVLAGTVESFIEDHCQRSHRFARRGAQGSSSRRSRLGPGRATMGRRSRRPPRAARSRR
jgi:hypothetical protein